MGSKPEKRPRSKMDTSRAYSSREKGSGCFAAAVLGLAIASLPLGAVLGLALHIFAH